MIKPFRYAFGRYNPIFLNAAICDSINECPQIDNSGEEVKAYIKDYYSYRDAVTIEEVFSVTYYAKNPLNAGFYSITLPATKDKWNDDFINEKPLTNTALTGKLQSQDEIKIDLLNCPTTQIEPLTPADKKMIVDTLGSDIKAIRREMLKEYPAEDLNRYTWTDIVKAVQKIKLRGSAATKTDPNGGGDVLEQIPDDYIHILKELTKYTDTKLQYELVTLLGYDAKTLRIWLDDMQCRGLVSLDFGERKGYSITKKGRKYTV